ncbi:MAG: EF-hand domain-containing protein [Nanoarchaeota archaeon]|nr:EF-hand domain-containing protein [Nanoarchaeota archaeon]
MPETIEKRSEPIFNSKARKVLISIVLGSALVSGVIASVQTRHNYSTLPEPIRQYDTNKDGYLSREEVFNFLNHYNLEKKN